MERLDRSGMGVSEETIKSVLELTHEMDFGAKLKLISVAQIGRETGLSRYLIHKKAGDKLLKFGGRYCVNRKDYKRLFSGKDDGSGKKENAGNGSKKKGS
jgi:hypothetical protein